MDNTLRSVIRLSRPYFGPTATQEMLEEWRPLMCPLDVCMGKAMIYLVKAYLEPIQ
jgi:proteasome activator subunit 4